MKQFSQPLIEEINDNMRPSGTSPLLAMEEDSHQGIRQLTL